MPAGGPDIIAACSVKGETSSLHPATSLLLVAVPIAASRRRMFKQASGLGFRKTHCHRRESRVSKLFFLFRQTSLRDLKAEKFLFLVSL